MQLFIKWKLGAGRFAIRDANFIYIENTIISRGYTEIGVLAVALGRDAAWNGARSAHLRHG